MTYQMKVNALAEDAEQLEQVFQAALQAGEVQAFRQAIDEQHTAVPENLLYAAWYYRLRQGALQAREFATAWGWVIPLALLNGLLFWWLSDDQRYMIKIAGVSGRIATDFLPVILLLAAPLAAVFVLVYLTAVGRKEWRLSAVIGVVLVVAAGYVYFVYPQAGTRPFQEQYLTLMAGHLPLLAWAGVGIFLIFNHRDPASRFAFLIKSLEIFIMGGLFLIAGGLFTGITVGLFGALGVDFPVLVQRLFVAGGGGLIPVVAVAVIYNPTVSPREQAFSEGLSKLIALLMRILLPLTFIVLVVYLVFIPLNFREPFENRDVLIIYNAMLFAVIALLVGATPISRAGLSPERSRLLRLGIIAVAALALLISLYALAAILYRTAIDRLTPNRLAFIGWNVANTGLLFLLLFYQMRSKNGRWLEGLYQVYAVGTAVYAAWALVMVLLLPWLFGINQGEIESLPSVVQTLIYEEPDPILLKCISSPHIYLLDDGEKRWIKDIATFDQRGYVWRDVHFIDCNSLGTIPDGEPIPADAGPPPQP